MQAMDEAAETGVPVKIADVLARYNLEACRSRAHMTRSLTAT